MLKLYTFKVEFHMDHWKIIDEGEDKELPKRQFASTAEVMSYIMTIFHKHLEPEKTPMQIIMIP